MRERMPEAHLEPALRRADGTLALEGPLELPYRADLMSRPEGNLLTVDTPIRVALKPFSEIANGTHIVLRPFLWDYARFAVGSSVSFDWLGVRAWFFRWFDADDTHALNEEGFYGVVHYLSDPHPIEGSATITVDFGSAPLEAFVDCVDTLVQGKPTRIEIG
jgi:hypothetical protein